MFKVFKKKSKNFLVLVTILIFLTFETILFKLKVLKFSGVSFVPHCQDSAQHGCPRPVRNDHHKRAHRRAGETDQILRGHSGEMWGRGQTS